MPDPSDTAPADPAAKPAQKPDEHTSKLGKFIIKYPTFLSSLLIGIAGLVATSMWQYRQSQTTRKQAEAQQKVAETQAANSWKIARAEILGKNLDTLASTGAATADQRYGVLVSLTRADILDPELAVSYALELGKDNADYMQSVLSNTVDKDYSRLARAFSLSCEERYGIELTLDPCVDKLAARSAALGQLIADETATAITADATPPGPLVLLKDERRVQLDVQQLTGLFGNALDSMYERRQWDELAKFEAFSPGAHLVGALVLAAARTGEFVTEDEAHTLEQFHDQQTKWLSDYLISKPCDAECKARMLEVMVSHYEEAQDDYDAALRGLFASPRAQSATAIAHLHSRLLWCQVDDTDLVPLRDHALVPAVTDLVANKKADPAARDAVISLLAVVPEPAPTDEGAKAWATMMTAVDKTSDKLSKMLKDRRAIAQRTRMAPPPAMKKSDFCIAHTTAEPAATDPLPLETPTPPH